MPELRRPGNGPPNYVFVGSMWKNSGSNKFYAFFIKRIFIAVEDTIREYFIVNDMEFVFLANDSNRVRVKCKAPGCKWMLFASLINKIEGKTMKVKKLENEHTCGMQLVTRKRGRPPLKNPSEETIKRKARRLKQQAIGETSELISISI
ncbi:hypothetical protein F8388_018877 [Cannabis sativa]|uniref:Transposase MuDR plant domain-containing protein n=1 Tax=Cannabis sativa TaxID=3483 RepID=A0A7J6FZT5_CANSA|nr:hypothetical protein F8388_018877 [Cannabis sativa]